MTEQPGATCSNGTEQPFVEITIRATRTLPDDTPKEEALEGARAAFRDEMESDEVEVDLRYVESDT